MNFDIIAPDYIKDERLIYTFGKDYLQYKNQDEQSLVAEECSLCQIEEATNEMVLSIQQKGYYIIEIPNCS